MEKGTLIKVLQRDTEVYNGVFFNSILQIYRDSNGEKKTIYTNRSKSTFYVVKDKNSPEATHPTGSMKLEKLVKHTVYTDHLFKEVAKEIGCTEYYDRCKSGNPYQFKQAARNMLRHPFLYGADLDICDEYTKQFHESFERDPSYKLHKAYFDIEVDLMYRGFKKDPYRGFPSEDIAPCPVSIITLIDEKYMRGYVFVCRNALNETLVKFEKDGEFPKKILGIVEEFDKLKLTDVHVHFFDTELETISTFFDAVHDLDPDYMLAWNSGYDVVTMKNRLTKLLHNNMNAVLGIMCDDKYVNQIDNNGNAVQFKRRAYYRQNKERANGSEAKMDSYDVTDGIVWLDQLCVFKSIRSGETKRDSYALNEVAKDELGKEKLEFAPGETFITQPWMDFDRFAQYNFRDSLLLMFLEQKGRDMDTVQQLSEITNTRKDKVFTKSTSIKNLWASYMLDEGEVIETNKNSKFGDDADYFDEHYLPDNSLIESDPVYYRAMTTLDRNGAFVGDPKNITSKGIEIRKGVWSDRIFEYVFDQDLASLYPSTIQAYNLDKSTIDGKFYYIDSGVLNKLIELYDYDGLLLRVKQNVDKSDEELFGEDANPEDFEYNDELGIVLSDMIQSQDTGRIGSVFMGLPTTEELLHKIEIEISENEGINYEKKTIQYI